MKIKFSKKLLINTLKKRLQLIVYAAIFIILIWTISFIYQNLYSSVIVPKEIGEREIFAKKKRVNLELFETVSNKISEKKTSISEIITTINNPFE